MKQIKDIISRIKFINLVNEISSNVYNTIFIGLVITITMIVGSKIVPIIFVANKLTVLYFFLVVMMIVFSISNTKKTWKYSLLKLDDKQRLITALEHENMEDELSIMQRKDAISYVASIDIEKEVPIIFWYREKVLKISIAVVVLLIVLFVPPFHNAQINKIEAASEIKKEVLKEINENKKLIQDMKLENQFKKEIMNALDKTKKELEKSNVKKDYKKDIEKQKKSLEDMIRKTQDALKKETEGISEQSKLLEELLKLDNLEDLQSVLEKYKLNDELLKDLQNLSKMQDSLKELLKNIDPKALENIMKNLQKELSSSSCSQTDSQNGQNQGGTLGASTGGSSAQNGNGSSNGSSSGIGSGSGKGDGASIFDTGEKEFIEGKESEIGNSESEIKNAKSERQNLADEKPWIVEWYGMSGQAGEIKSKEILEEYGDKVKWNASADDEIPLEVRDLVQDYFSEDE